MLKKRGIWKETSRFGEQINEMMKPGKVSSGSKGYEETFLGLRDVGILYTILKNIPDEDSVNNKLKVCMKDPLRPTENKKNTNGRDAQFELFLYAVALQGELQPELGEPDIICKIDSCVFGIAAKRVTSEKKLVERMDDAADQICKSGCPGIVAMDLSLLWNPEDMSLDGTEKETYETIETLQTKIGDKLKSILEEKPKIACTSYGKGVLGYLVFLFYLNNKINVPVYIPARHDLGGGRYLKKLPIDL